MPVNPRVTALPKYKEQQCGQDFRTSDLQLFIITLFVLSSIVQLSIHLFSFVNCRQFDETNRQRKLLEFVLLYSVPYSMLSIILFIGYLSMMTHKLLTAIDNQIRLHLHIQFREKHCCVLKVISDALLQWNYMGKNRMVIYIRLFYVLLILIIY